MQPFQSQPSPSETPLFARGAQAGGALLSAVATAGIVLVLVQGTLFYKGNQSTKFLNSEKNKVVAQQLAEAGVSENIADLGKRIFVPTTNMQPTTTYNHQTFGNGTFSTTVALAGASRDTVDVQSTGAQGPVSQTVHARLRVKNYVDSVRTPISVATPDTTLTITSKVIQDTTATTTTKDPSTMPALDQQPAYTAFMASGSKKADICHLPGGDVTKANVINVARASVGTHISHHGDYLTTDGSCDQYKPKTTLSITTHTEFDTLVVITQHITYDTVVTLDTLTKIKVVSWR